MQKSIFGQDETALIQLQVPPDASSGPIDLVFSLAALALVIGLLAYPWLTGRKPGWREINND